MVSECDACGGEADGEFGGRPLCAGCLGRRARGARAGRPVARDGRVIRKAIPDEDPSPEWQIRDRLREDG